MSEYRKSGVVAIGLVLAVVTACSSAPAPSGPAPAAAPYVPAANPPRPADCAPPPAPDLTRTSGWLGRIVAEPETVGLVVDDGRGAAVSHGADVPMPLASAVKVVHLAAYGRAVAEGRLRPDEPVRVADWEAWYFPADGGAHQAALDRLGVPRAGALAADPTRTVTLDQLVSAMIQESDNAATDLLRDRLGDDALVRAAADGGWTGFDLPSLLGSTLALTLPETAPPIEAPRAERAPVEVGLARRYAADPAFRAEAQRRLVSFVEDVEGFLLANEAWAARTAAGTPAQLAGMYRALASGAYGPGSDVARRQLEWQGPTPGVGTVGFKGGRLTGVQTLGSSVRREDGTIALAVVLARGLPVMTGTEAVSAQQQLVLRAVDDPRAFARLVCVA